MDSYEQNALIELQIWQLKMQKDPSLFDKVSKGVQDKINSYIPEKAHDVITATIRKMVEAVLFGSTYTTANPLKEVPLAFREIQLQEKVKFYRNAAAAEGAATGAGGILLGLADFPLLIGFKIKLLYEIAAIYGHDVRDYRERLFILYIFQLSFSSTKRRKEVFHVLETWDTYIKDLPDKVENFDWRTFQQEYRDYIDLVKMAQLIPFIGAAVGAVANFKLLEQLGEMAQNSYRMRYFRILPDEIG